MKYVAVSRRQGGFDWRDVAPPGIAATQAAWERRRIVCRMLEVGISKEEVAKFLDIGTPRLNQLLKKADEDGEPPIWGWLNSTESIQAIVDFSPRYASLISVWLGGAGD